MAEIKRGDEMKGDLGERLPSDDPTVVAPRFDEREEATARPVVPLGRSSKARTIGGSSLRAISRHLVLAWAVVATLAAGTIAIYQNAQTSEPQVAPQPAPESTAGQATPTPQPTLREFTLAPARATKITEARDPQPSPEVPVWSARGDAERDELGEEEKEELEERARKEEKRRRKEEKRRREQAEEEAEEAEEEAERARKAARKQAERQRERRRNDEKKARLVGVLTRQD